LAGDYQTPERMAVKRAAVPLPYIAGRSLLDVGCDHGAWCQAAQEAGATRVVGVDRGRDVPGVGWVDLAERNTAAIPGVEFRRLEIGRQWHDLGRFDVVLLLNLYHHVYQVAGDHEPIWYWLWRHTAGQLLWEAPLSKVDPVAAQHVTLPYHEHEIRAAAERYFDIEDIGPGWVDSRRVWRCWPKPRHPMMVAGQPRAGAGGATRAFEYANGRRMDEIESALGVRPIAGSLNVELPEPLDWDRRYYRAQVLDVADRGMGLDSEWRPRWARFYPVLADGQQAWAFRFEGESYPWTFVELIADRKLRGADVVILDF
jgi:SAM-dependent methyltransferase